MATHDHARLTCSSWTFVHEHIADMPQPYPNVHVLDKLVTNDDGQTVCPVCERTMIKRVDPVPDWTEGLGPAYRCGHCGTRFGTKGDASIAENWSDTKNLVRTSRLSSK